MNLCLSVSYAFKIYIYISHCLDPAGSFLTFRFSKFLVYVVEMVNTFILSILSILSIKSL